MDINELFFYTIPLYINQIILYLFYGYCRFVTKLKNLYKHCYDYNASIKELFDQVHYVYSIIKGSILGLRVEPMEKYWMASCCLSSKVLSNKYEMDEYVFPMTENTSLETTIKYLENMYEISKNYLKNNICCYNDFLFIVSDDEYKHFRICNKEYNTAPKCLSREPAFISFINIGIYIPNHPKSPFFVIGLEKSVYLVDNVLFTPTFVKRLLEYNVGLNVFDMDYTIKLMDSNIRFITLTSSEYIVLEKNGYRIVKMKKMDAATTQSNDDENNKKYIVK